MTALNQQQPMTGWYDPRRLLAIGIRVAEATVFGQMFDRRELMASLDPFDAQYFNDNFDFSDPRFQEADGDFWLDFAADTGDGWHSTYAVARLLARPELKLGDQSLPQGRVLVFGGDQVYPTASEKDYRLKLKAPFNAANALENKGEPATVFDPQTKRFRGRHVFAIPGNHDWYDDLTAFTGLFCNKAPDRPGAVHSPGRTVCGRATAQTRSYFALKLPHDWWLCAFDAQLAGYIDAPQLRFFEYVAQHLMAPGSNVILSVAGPVWAYSQTGEAEGFSNFAFASLIATGAINYPGYKPERQHNLRLVLTGDSHHYAHFVESAAVTAAGEPAPGPVIHYLTCGLGGAFLHPTHWLTNTGPKVHWAPPPPLQPYVPGQERARTQRHFNIVKDGDGSEKLFPDRKTSRRMTWRNLMFGWLNPWFGAFMAGVGIFAAWLLHFGARTMGTALAADLGNGSLGTRLWRLFLILFDTPWPLLVMLGIGAALVYFSDCKGWLRGVSGVIHALIHFIIFFAVLLIVAAWLPNDFWIVLVTGVATGVTAPTVMGLYLLVMLNGFGVHWNEAYSSLRIADFKGFLRLRINGDGDLEVYPIVLDTVPRSDDGMLNYRLFEGPIQIPKTPAHV